MAPSRPPLLGALPERLVVHMDVLRTERSRVLYVMGMYVTAETNSMKGCHGAYTPAMEQ